MSSSSTTTTTETARSDEKNVNNDKNNDKNNSESASNNNNNKKLKMSPRKRILITGSSGYLGQHLLYSWCCCNDNDDKKNNKNPYKPSDKERLLIIAAYGTLESFEADASTKLPILSTPTIETTAETDERPIVVKLVGNIDLSNEISIQQLSSISNYYDIVINLAAMSSPIACHGDENKERKASLVNSPELLLDMLLSSTAATSKDLTNPNPNTPVIIHISSDLVYDGLNPIYTESHETKPINHYGLTKSQFERILTSKCRNQSVILRSSLILGPIAPLGICRRKSFLQFIQQRLTEKKTTDYFMDEIRSSVFVMDLIQAITYFVSISSSSSSSLMKNVAGIYNAGGSNHVSKFDMAMAVANHLGYTDQETKQYIHGIQRSSMPHLIPSPPNISMDMTKLETVVGMKMKGINDILDHTFPLPKAATTKTTKEEEK